MGRLRMDKIDRKEVRIVTSTGGPEAPIHIRLIHIPTGIEVEGLGKFRYRLCENLFVRLEKKIKGEGQIGQKNFGIDKEIKEKIEGEVA